MTNPDVPQHAYGTGQPAANWPAQPWQQQPGYQPAPQYAPMPPAPQFPPPGAGRPPGDRSVFIALLLTFLFGPLGLFYSSIIGGLLLVLASIAVGAIGVLTLGVGFLLLWLIWPISMVWGGVSASLKHRRFQAWQTMVMTPR